MSKRFRSVHALLGTDARRRPRKRGFVPWKPQAARAELLAQAQAVLEEYADHLPLTIRQIFYRLVGAHGYEKTEAASDRLIGTLNRARRAQLIPMSGIRDDGGIVSDPHYYEDASHFWSTVRMLAGDFNLDRTFGQKSRLAVICEARGMVPQLERVAHPYGIPVISSGGFDSLTDKYAFAAQLADQDRPTEVLHIGDHDPSGVHLFLALSEDVRAFARALGGKVSFTRLAVTPQQIAAYALPTAPPKHSDRRAFAGETAQAEALAPDDLAAILRDAIEARLDHNVYEAVLRREELIRDQLVERLEEE
jgi:hypothetical protein